MVAAKKSDAVKAEAARAVGEEPEAPAKLDVEFEGRVYTIRADAMMDVEVLEAVEDEKWIWVMRLVLGIPQWKAFKNQIRTEEGRVPAARLEEFLGTVMAAADPRNAS